MLETSLTPSQKNLAPQIHFVGIAWLIIATKPMSRPNSSFNCFILESKDVCLESL